MSEQSPVLLPLTEKKTVTFSPDTKAGGERVAPLAERPGAANVVESSTAGIEAMLAEEDLVPIGSALKPKSMSSPTIEQQLSTMPSPNSAKSTQRSRNLRETPATTEAEDQELEQRLKVASYVLYLTSKTRLSEQRRVCATARKLIEQVEDEFVVQDASLIPPDKRSDFLGKGVPVLITLGSQDKGRIYRGTRALEEIERYTKAMTKPKIKSY